MSGSSSATKPEAQAEGFLDADRLSGTVKLLAIWLAVAEWAG